MFRVWLILHISTIGCRTQFLHIPVCFHFSETPIPTLERSHSIAHLSGLIANYPVITAIIAVITLILVFWVRKRQMGGSAVSSLCPPSASCIRGNYCQGFISTLLSDGRMTYNTYQHKRNGHMPHHMPHTIYNKKTMYIYHEHEQQPADSRSRVRR